MLQRGLSPPLLPWSVSIIIIMQSSQHRYSTVSMLSGSSVYVISAVPRRSVIPSGLSSLGRQSIPSSFQAYTSASVVLVVRCGSLLPLLIQMPVSHAGKSLYVVAWSLSPARASDDSAARRSLVACSLASPPQQSQ